MKRVVDALAVRPIGYVIRRLGQRPDVNTRLTEIAIEDSAQYYIENMGAAQRYRDRYPLFDHSMSQAVKGGLVLEFGCYQGKSLRYIAERIDGVIHGFDSFEGLAEDWAGNVRKGHFDLKGKLPKVPPNVTLHKGWFEDTLPPFLDKNQSHISFLHCDADTYESTAYVLEQCAGRIVDGTVIQFDEYFGYPGWRLNEYRAFQEYIASSGRSYRYLGFGWMSVAVQITA